MSRIAEFVVSLAFAAGILLAWFISLDLPSRASAQTVIAAPIGESIVVLCVETESSNFRGVLCSYTWTEREATSPETYFATLVRPALAVQAPAPQLDPIAFVGVSRPSLPGG